jgi:hypothetical protein
MSELAQATRPNTNSTGQQIDLVSNYFPFIKQSTAIQKYAVAFNPEIPAQLERMRERVIRRVGKTLREKIGKFVLANTVIFATVASNEEPEAIELTCSYDNQDYTINVTPVGH